MYRCLVVAIVLAYLGGCAQSPLEVRQNGHRTNAMSRSAPLIAAHCVIREAESMTFGIGARPQVSLRPYVEPDSYEIVIDVSGTVGYILLQPKGTETSITIWRAASPLIGISRIDQLAERC